MAGYSSSDAPPNQQASTLQVTNRARAGGQARKPVLEKKKALVIVLQFQIKFLKYLHHLVVVSL